MKGRRTRKGQFTPGNQAAKGHGRPKRSTELQYLRELSDAVSVDAWQSIVKRAVDDAKKGDAKAREWLARYLLGVDVSLSKLAEADEARSHHEAMLAQYEITEDDYQAAIVDEKIHPSGDAAILATVLGGETLYQRARRLVDESNTSER